MRQDQGNTRGKKAVCFCTKADLGPQEAFEFAKKSFDRPVEYLRLSTQTGEGIDKLGELLFRQLNIIRIYAKPPGKPADMESPFTLPAGTTVQGLAMAIHRELAQRLKSARIWGTGVYDGQSVHLTHVLHDKDIVELHFG